MTDAPREIWARSEHSDENSYGGFWIKHPVQPATRYIRADALTLADCLAVPEVRELVDALKFYSTNYGEWPSPNEGPWGRDSDDFGRVADAALRKLEGGYK